MPPKLRRKKTLKKTVRKNRRTRRKLAKTIKKQLRENRTAVVVVGRFQPPHKGHINMIKGGIELLMGESSISNEPGHLKLKRKERWIYISDGESMHGVKEIIQ